jgi:hypothetical protein
MAGARVALALCVLLLADGVARRAEASSYNVGNRAGWDLSADLPSWANGKTFYVGDVLGTRNRVLRFRACFLHSLFDQNAEANDGPDRDTICSRCAP